MRVPKTPIQLYTNKEDIPFLLRHCAEQLLVNAKLTGCSSLLCDFAADSDYEVFCTSHPDINEIVYRHTPNEDTLGLLYQSLCAIEQRKSTGSFYTPAAIAKRLITTHFPAISDEQTIFDPACGTGIFFLELPDSIPLDHLYGNDLNHICITITRINLALKYRVSTSEELAVLYQHFTVSDYLSSTEAPAYDIILGNPPWGATLSDKQKKQYMHTFSCANQNNMEIFDLFIEQALRQLVPDGFLSFVLPEALFTVRLHAPIRALLLASTTAVSVEYLGNVFKNVYCPSIILTVKKEPSVSFYRNTIVTNKTKHYRLCADRALSSDYFSFSLTDEEYFLLEKLKRTANCVTLKGNADFALGIVTGNNDLLIYDTPQDGAEPILRGSDISKYHIHRFSGYLRFVPEELQQTAPETYYRAKEKLFYRFINRQLTFAYDDTGLLSLNSCNIVIPRIEGVPVKYILAVLNSKVAQFIFEKQFASVKVLRSHLEAIPIPLSNDRLYCQIVDMVDILISTDSHSEEFRLTYCALEQQIAQLYDLTGSEYQLIAASVDDFISLNKKSARKP